MQEDRLDRPRVLARPLRVLVADDDDLMAQVLALKLSSLGCDVDVVPDGHAAAQRVADTRFDVLVTDWMMPGLNGIDLVKQLRQQRDDENYLYIIMVTARASAESVRDGLSAGVDDFLRKPIDDIELELGIASARRIVGLQANLARRTRHIAAAHERARVAYRRIKSDLEAAAATQRQLIPPASSLGGLRTDGVFLPSSDIGGDIYNVIERPDGQVLFFHVDVAGHGIPAALRSFAIHSRLSTLSPAASLPNVLAAMNADALQRDAAFFTMIGGIFDPSTGICRLLRAGHPPAICLRSSGAIEIIEDGDMPVGLVPGATYTEITTELALGDRLFLYSDGITECEDAAGHQLGEDGLIGILASGAKLVLGESVSRIARAVEAHRGARAFEDDVSLLALERSA